MYVAQQYAVKLRILIQGREGNPAKTAKHGAPYASQHDIHFN